MNRRLALAAVPLLLGSVLLGGSPATAVPTIQPAAAAATGPALSVLESLPVAAPQWSGYRRSSFTLWTDADRDGCDTRREVILSEAATAPIVTGACRIDRGAWTSAYDGATATGYPARFDVDHLVPLAEAWASGARAWNASRRTAFANDLDHPQALILVSAASNRTKSASDPATWMPPAQAAWCGYAGDWVRVKAVWGLNVDPVEKAALTRILNGCTGFETLVTSS